MRNTRTEEFLSTYDECADSIFRLCYGKTSNREEAKDMTQEAFARVWDRLDRQQEEIENMRAFLYAVARNLIKDYYKKKKPVLERDLPEGTFQELPADEPAAGLSAESELILRAMKDLADPYREALTLHLVEGFAIREVADLLGERPNTISVRVKRGLEKVRTALHIT